MAIKTTIRHIYLELKEHTPFTLLGAVLGVVFMLIFRNVGQSVGHKFFTVLHPGHVILSGMVTASMFKIHRKKTSFLTVLIVGYLGAIGVATLSDSIIPFFGEKLLGLNVPTESRIHHILEHSHSEDEHLTKPDSHSGHNHHHSSGIHFGFIEEWYIVNPAAIAGVLIAWFWPKTRFPHAGHVLISTWASSSYVIMTAQNDISIMIAMAMVLVLFISTWVPCCISDIVFPLLLTGHHTECKTCSG